MIRSFACRDTELVFNMQRTRKFDPIGRQARRKLILLDEAGRVEELRSPPGNRLEALRGNRAGQHSIRINDQWRIVFAWREDGPHDVAIVDYH